MRLVLLALLVAQPALAAPVPTAVTADPPVDTAHPAAMAAFTIPSGGAMLNAVMYTAAGAGLHPTLLLFHGFPGNEQNLDLAQAARRAGWNVLTLHYRGSWGSGGTFSFAHCVEDGANAVAFVRQPATIARFGIDPRRIAIAGHSMGGIVAARAAAGDPRIIGTFLIDPADLAADGRSFADPGQREDFLTGEVRGDMPPLAGTSEAAIMDEVAHAGPSLDLVATMPALAGRPLALIGATRGIGAMAAAAATAARSAGATHLEAVTLPTDHSFSDMRIALAGRLVAWLAQFDR
ncbi:MAG: alpha/beta hydrolase family protein [Janthinobacterium lividum]